MLASNLPNLILLLIVRVPVEARRLRLCTVLPQILATYRLEQLPQAVLGADTL